MVKTREQGDKSSASLGRCGSELGSWGLGTRVTALTDLL